MCCKDEHGRDKVFLPIGTGHCLSEANIVVFVPWMDVPVDNDEAAQRFHDWLANTVSGGFYDALKRELSD